MANAQYAILRFAKYKGPEISGIEAHNERTKEKYASNPDIDPSRTHLNFHLIHIVTAKRRRYAIIDNRKKDEWSGFADLLANLIEKYAAVLDIENLPEPPICLDSEKKEIVNNSKLFEESIEKTDIA